MEEIRKLIKFGKSAFCITVPHTWLKKNKIKKGDSLNVQETLRNSLEVVPMKSSSERAHELSIDITEKSTDEIIQLLLSTYLNGYTTILLIGPNAGKIGFLRKHIHEFIAAEIMEVTSNRIMIHIFWDINTLSLDSIIMRIGHITKSIFLETRDLVDLNINLLDITEKNFEVQRQVLLARRAIKYALNNASAAYKFNFSALELMYISYIIYFFGMISDYVLRVAQIIDRAKQTQPNTLNTPVTRKELKDLIQRTADYYGKVFDSYNKHNKEVKFVFSEYADFEVHIDEFRKKNASLWTPLVAEYLRSLIFKIKETELNMISMENAPK